MYEYTDYYDEAENGGVDGGALLLSRKNVISLLKQHGYTTPYDWCRFFSETRQLCLNSYPASSVLRWLNY